MNRALWPVALAFAGACSVRDMPPPCDETTHAKLMAECTARIAAECRDTGNAPCIAEDECVDKLRAREETCLTR
jgi:hypothetical protein